MEKIFSKNCRFVSLSKMSTFPCDKHTFILTNKFDPAV